MMTGTAYHASCNGWNLPCTLPADTVDRQVSREMKNRLRHCLIFIIAAMLLLMQGSIVLAEDSQELTDCSRLEDDEQRLKCYDEYFSRQAGIAASAAEPSFDTAQRESTSDSYLTRLWELNEKKPRGRYAIMAHRPNYILPVAYNTSPNKEPIQESPGQDVKHNEVKFQISLKVKLWQDILGQNMDLWFGYTQLSFWQLYNLADSAPFRETDYEPEMLLNFRTNFGLFGMKGRTVQVGFNHQSNGRPEPLSRSWNRIVGNVGFERGDLTLLLKTWYRIPESSADDDNPDIDDYLGNGEVWGYYTRDGHRFGVMVRNNLNLSDNRGALQLEWCFPLISLVTGYIQYFNGFGESLIDYDHRVNRISIGFILKDWN